MTSDQTIRIAMWSGPRNISTAMMRAFENRGDCAVWDEPFYAPYLKATGLDHPMRDEIIAAHDSDPRSVAATIGGPVPGGKLIWYQKHMNHHMIEGMPVGWADHVVNCFLIREPEFVLASYAAKRAEVTLADIGFVAQADMFNRLADKIGTPPPVVDSNLTLADPKGVLSMLCARIGIPFTERMLAWPAGRRDSDGIWAKHWYGAVEASTGFGKPRLDLPDLPVSLARIADAARPHYETMKRHALRR